MGRTRSVDRTEENINHFFNNGGHLFLTSHLGPLWWPNFVQLLICCSQDPIILTNIIKRFLAIFLRLSHKSYTLTLLKRQSKQQKWPLVYQSSHVYQDCTNRVPTVYQSSKTVKRQSKQKKMTIGVPIVTCLHRVHLIHKVRVQVNVPIRVRVPVHVRRIHKAPIESCT